MTRPGPGFRDRLAAGPPVLLDGALGTELERRGEPAPLPLWSAAALLGTGESLRAIHRDYVRAGAEVLSACTFRTNPRALGRAGLAGRDAGLTRRAVELAREAADGSAHPVWVAGSVAPVEDCFEPGRVPAEAELAAEHRRHAENLVAAGVDLALIETMNTAREAAAALSAARQAGLPAGVCLVLRDPEHLLGGDRLEDAVALLAPLEPLFLGVNCGPPGRCTQALAVLARTWPGPRAVYANLGTDVDGRWRHGGGPDETRDYLEAARGWVKSGARLVGGCCGTDPGLIARLRSEVGGLVPNGEEGQS
jgi:S-methylmethionine-dependent homocysteine/selenocysteine methylase